MRGEHVEIRKILGRMGSFLEGGRMPDGPDEVALENVLGAHNTREEGLYYPFFDAQFTSGDGKMILSTVRTKCHCGERHVSGTV